MSDSARPHRWQPTGLLCPWDSPSKNTRVGCHLLLQCMKVKSESAIAQSCLTLSDPMDCSPPGSSVHGIFQARVLEWGAIGFSLAPLHYRHLSLQRYNDSQLKTTTNEAKNSISGTTKYSEVYLLYVNEVLKRFSGLFFFFLICVCVSHWGQNGPE